VGERPVFSDIGRKLVQRETNGLRGGCIQALRFLVLITRALPLVGIFLKLKLGRDLVKVPQAPTASPSR